MIEPTLTDRIRDLVEGRLAPDTAAAVRAAAAREPEAAAFLAAYAAIHGPSATLAGAAPPVPAVRRPGIPSWLRLAAGALLIATGATAGAALALRQRSAGPESVGPGVPAPATVGETPVGPAQPPEPPVAPRPGFHAVVNGAVRWLDSLDEGNRVATEVGRPVLLFIAHPTCPMCQALDRETFSDAEVQARVAGFVPVRLNVMTVPPDVQALAMAGWPYLAARDASGRTLCEFPGQRDAAEMRAALDDARERAGETPAPGGTR